MKRTFRVITEARACKEIPGYRPSHNKPFGYIILIEPPVVRYKTCEDVEGVGLWHYPQPQKWLQFTVSWCKEKVTALKVQQEKEQSQYYSNIEDDPRPDHIWRDIFGNKLTD